MGLLRNGFTVKWVYCNIGFGSKVGETEVLAEKTQK